MGYTVHWKIKIGYRECWEINTTSNYEVIHIKPHLMKFEQFDKETIGLFLLDRKSKIYRKVGRRGRPFTYILMNILEFRLDE